MTNLHRLPIRRGRLIAILAGAPPLLAAALAAATLVGNISNVATGNLLEGARETARGRCVTR